MNTYYRAARWIADLKKLTAIGLRVPADGFGPAREELLTDELRRVFKTQPVAIRTHGDLWVVAVAGVRTLVVLVVALLGLISGLADDLVRIVAYEGAGLFERIRWRREAPGIRRAESRPGGPLFEDANDVLFIEVMLLMTALTVLIFWWIRS